MTSLIKFAAAGLVVLALLLGALFFTVLRAPEAASGPVTAVPLAATSAQASVNNTTDTSADDGASTTAAAAVTGDAILAQIVQGESKARFVIDEVLNDAPKTVIGTTDQVAGQLVIDPQDPTQTRVGTIQVNARTLTTDSDFRNRAIKNQILSTDQYEFVTFTSTEVIGLPGAGEVGQSYSFQIVGNLSIRDTTKQATFDVTVTPTLETRLEGTAQTTIRYADWGISIPQVRQVASVSDDVRLEIDFVAVPQ